MRTAIRIISGTLGGRKVTCDVTPELRPTPDRVAGAYFSILGNAVPGAASSMFSRGPASSASKG